MTTTTATATATAPSPGESRPGVIEVLNRSGQVMQRLDVREGDWRIGRAYDNDLIVDDPYVCPHHLRLEVRGSEVTLVDLDSRNGTWARGGRERVDSLDMGEGGTVQFGHSQLRYRSPDEPVQPAWVDFTSRGALRLLSRRWLVAPALLAGLVSLAMGRYLEAMQPMKLGALANSLVYPVLGLMLWAGVWALVNRLVSHRANYTTHLVIASLGMTGLFLVDEGLPLLAFAFDLGDLMGPVTLLAEVLILGVLLFAHIQYVAHGRGRVQALGAAVTAIALVGLPALGNWLAREDFRSQPDLDPLLKPPAFRVVRGDSVSGFLERAESLRSALDQESASESPSSQGNSDGS